MKRTPLRRKTPLRSPSSVSLRKTQLARSGEGKKRRQKRTAQKRASKHTRDWVKAVLARDGHRCTALHAHMETLPYHDTFAHPGVKYGPEYPGDRNCMYRCHHTSNLHVHHLTYRNLGVEELEDGVTLCESHHRFVEAMARPWNVRRLG